MENRNPHISIISSQWILQNEVSIHFWIKTFPTNFPTNPNFIHKFLMYSMYIFVDDILISWKICGKSFDWKVNRYFIWKYSSITYDGYVWISILHRMKRYGLICGYIIFIKLSLDMILLFEIERDYHLWGFLTSIE